MCIFVPLHMCTSAVAYRCIRIPAGLHSPYIPAVQHFYVHVSPLHACGFAAVIHFNLCSQVSVCLVMTISSTHHV